MTKRPVFRPKSTSLWKSTVFLLSVHLSTAFQLLLHLGYCEQHCGCLFKMFPSLYSVIYPEISCGSYCTLNFRFGGKARQLLKLVISFACVPPSIETPPHSFNNNSFHFHNTWSTFFLVYYNQEHLSCYQSSL